METQVTEARAVAKHIRISPLKARSVINLIRGKSTKDALAILKFTPNKAAALIEKVLKSAIANAENNYEMDAESLIVKKAYVDEGATLKRLKPRAQGRADRIRKRTSHITVIVSEKKEG